MKKKGKKVSIIMTIYNQEKYLARAFDSILNQTYENMEIIALNDGSTDGTLDIIMEYAKKDDRIVVLSRKNEGRVNSLNQAIKLSTGDYIAIMDGDDVAHKEKIEKQVNFLEEHLDVYMVGVKIETVCEEGMEQVDVEQANFIQQAMNRDFDRNNLLSYLDEMQLFHPAATLVRRELFDIVGGYRDYQCEDGEFLFRTIQHGLKVDRIDEVLFTYYKYKDSRSSELSVLMKSVIEYKLEYIKEKFGFGEGKFQYAIWGRCMLTPLVVNTIQKVFKNTELVAYVEEEQEGEIEGVTCIHPDRVKEMDVDYILISGFYRGKEIKEKLEDMGFMHIKDFFLIA